MVVNGQGTRIHSHNSIGMNVEVCSMVVKFKSHVGALRTAMALARLIIQIPEG